MWSLVIQGWGGQSHSTSVVCLHGPSPSVLPLWCDGVTRVGALNELYYKGFLILHRGQCASCKIRGGQCDATWSWEAYREAKLWQEPHSWEGGDDGIPQIDRTRVEYTKMRCHAMWKRVYYQMGFGSMIDCWHQPPGRHCWYILKQPTLTKSASRSSRDK